MPKGFKLLSDQHGGYPHNWELKQGLGLEHKYGRDETKESTWMGVDRNGAITEIRVVLLSADEAKRLHPHSTKPRRLHAECPSCKRLVCAGHTVQHRC